MTFQNKVKPVKYYNGEGFGCFAYYHANNNQPEKLWSVKQSFEEIMVFDDVIASDGVVWTRKKGFFTHGKFRAAIQELVYGHLMYNIIHKPFGFFQKSDYLKSPKVIMNEILNDFESEKGLLSEKSYIEGMTRDLIDKGHTAENNIYYLAKLMETVSEKLEKIVFTNSDLEEAKLMVLDDNSSPEGFIDLIEKMAWSLSNIEFIYFSIKFLKTQQFFNSKNILKGFQKTSHADLKISENKAEFLQRSVKVAFRDFEVLYFSLDAFYKKDKEWNMKALAKEALEIKKVAEAAVFGIS